MGAPNDRARLERLCRYLLRPPLVQDRLRLRADGRVAVKLKGAWRDGTTHLVFEPLEFLAKLSPAQWTLVHPDCPRGVASSYTVAAARRLFLGLWLMTWALSR